jgi:iron complex outermembrane recepter protein
MKKILTFIILISLSLSLFAQQQNQVKGKVFDAYNGHALQDVNIQITGGGGTVTDKNGEFILTWKDSLEITITHVSYETYKFIVKKQQQLLKIGLIPTSYNLNEVSINSSRIETNKNLTIPQSIAVITPKEVDREDGLSFDKVVNLEPGIFSQVNSVPGSFGNGVSGLGGAVMIRGYLGDRMSGGAKMYLNGIPLTDGQGNPEYNDVDFSIIGETEIIKGPSSSLYGSGIGGVVKMYVLQPKPLSTRIVEQATIGSFGLYRTNTRIESATNNSSIILNYGHQYYDGWISNSNSRQEFVTFAGTFRPSEKQTVFIYSSYTDLVGSINTSSLDSASFFNKVKPQSTSNLSINERPGTEFYRIGASDNYMFSKHFSNLTSVFCSGTVGGGDNIGERTEFNLNFGTEKFGVKGIVGNELQKSTSSSIKYNALSDGTNGALNTFENYTAFQHNIFTEWNLILPYHFFFTAGASYNFMEFGIVDHLGYPGNPSNKKSNTGFKRFDPILTPRIALLKSFKDNFSVYVNISQGYQPYNMSKTIVINYLGVVDKDLKPEQGTQYEIGTKGSFLNKKLSYQFAAFRLDVEDKITTQSVYKSDGSILYSWYTNSGHQIDQGIELSATYALINDHKKFLSSLQPFIAFTYSDFYYQDFKSDNNNNKKTLDYTGKKAILVPPVLFNAGIDLACKLGIYLTTTLRYVDKQWGDYANLHSAPAYTLFGATIGYKKSLGNHFLFNICAGANNLTNSLYYYGGGSSVTPLGETYIPAPFTSTFYTRLTLSYKI